MLDERLYELVVFAQAISDPKNLLNGQIAACRPSSEM